tara:strand:+ start:103 stop:555 length:453 start_codon:yes stop_codon:yes gene_type:complete
LSSEGYCKKFGFFTMLPVATITPAIAFGGTAFLACTALGAGALITPIVINLSVAFGFATGGTAFLTAALSHFVADKKSIQERSRKKEADKRAKKFQLRSYFATFALGALTALNIGAGTPNKFDECQSIERVEDFRSTIYACTNDRKLVFK